MAISLVALDSEPSNVNRTDVRIPPAFQLFKHDSKLVSNRKVVARDCQFFSSVGFSIIVSFLYGGCANPLTWLYARVGYGRRHRQVLFSCITSKEGLQYSSFKALPCVPV